MKKRIKVPPPGRLLWPVIEVLPVIGVCVLYDKFLDSIEFRSDGPEGELLMSVTARQLEKILMGANKLREAPDGSKPNTATTNPGL